MGNRYDRNRIYIDKKEQKIIKNFPVVIAGAGIGSIIAECILRLGFERITIIDGDKVESSNLNRQNYIQSDVGTHKTEAIKLRLEAINRDAVINIHSCFITQSNIEELLSGHKIAINALDFTSDLPIKFDEVAKKHEIPVLHPYNLGWAGLVTVVTAKSIPLSIIANADKEFNEIDVVEYVLDYLQFSGKNQKWLFDVLEKYKKEESHMPPPQLSIASCSVAAMSAHILFKLATGKKVKQFPEFYFSSIMGS